MFDSLKKLNSMITETRKQVAAKAQIIIKEAFKDLFDAHPEIEAIRWTQFTPYFNDGEPCEFSVSYWSIKATGLKSKYETDEPGEFLDEYSLSEENQSKFKDIYELFGLLDNDAMLVTFGDHAEITATKDGFEVDSCDHD